MSSKDRDRPIDSKSEEPLSRRRFLASTTAGVASALLTTQATADTLADVPLREVGADLSGHGERSKFVHLAMLPEAGPGKRNAHEITDAITAVVINAQAGLHLLRAQSPDLEQVRQVLNSIANDGKRAGDIVVRTTRALMKKVAAAGGADPCADNSDEWPM